MSSLSEYCFAIYPLTAKLFGANLIVAPAKDHGHDLPAMLKAITSQTRIVFVANPNSPTGTAVPKQELTDFANQVPPTFSSLSSTRLILSSSMILMISIPEIRRGPTTQSPFDADLLKNFRPRRPAPPRYGIGQRGTHRRARKKSASRSTLTPSPMVARSQRSTTAIICAAPATTMPQSIALRGRFFKKLGPTAISSPRGGNFILVRVGDGQRVFEALQKLPMLIPFAPNGRYQLTRMDPHFEIGTPQKTIAFRIRKRYKTVFESEVIARRRK